MTEIGTTIALQSKISGLFGFARAEADAIWVWVNLHGC